MIPSSTPDDDDELDPDPVQTITELLLRHVVPLYRQPRGKRPEHVGTAFLMYGQGHHFLVTAAHVVAEPQGMFFYVDVNTKRALTGRMMRSRSASTGEADWRDVAVVLLEEPGLPPYPGIDKTSGDLDLFLVGPTEPGADDVYLATGMPASRTKANPHTSQIKVEAFSLVASSAPAATYAALGRKARDHLVMTLNRQDSQNIDGTPRVFPDPHGMSGSPVWRLATESNGVEGVQLAGVLTEFHEAKNALVAIRIDHALRLIDALLEEVSAKAAAMH